MKKIILSALLLSVASCNVNMNRAYYYDSMNPEKMAQLSNKIFEEMDKNKDEKICQKEWDQASKKKFEEIDVNNDKKISKEEMMDYKQKMHHEMSKRKDCGKKECHKMRK